MVTMRQYRLYGPDYETPRQRRIRHNWPVLCGSMTRAEKMQHVAGLRSLASSKEREGDVENALALRTEADSFERTHLKERDWRK